MKIAGLTLILTLSGVLSASMVDEAKKAGFKPIPTDEKELLKLIDNRENPLNSAKIELGKRLYF